MPFKAYGEKRLAEEYGRSPGGRAHLKQVADHGAREVKQNLRKWVLQSGKGEVISGVRVRDGRTEGYFGVKSSYWHLEEFGTAKMPPQAPIRRAATTTLARFGGRYKQESRP